MDSETGRPKFGVAGSHDHQRVALGGEAPSEAARGELQAAVAALQTRAGQLREGVQGVYPSPYRSTRVRRARQAEQRPGLRSMREGT